MKRLGIGVFLFVIALIPRLYKLDLMEYNSDQIWSQYQVSQFYSHPQIIMTGLVSSIGVTNAPLFHYLLIILNFFSKNPYYVTLSVAFINAFSIGIFYVLLKRFYKKHVIFIAALLWSFSPWMILYSRSIWAQSLLPPFVVLFLYFLHRLMQDNDTTVSGYLTMLLLLIFQLHPSGVYLLILTLCLFYWIKPRFDLLKALAGLVIGIIPALPFVYYEITSKPICPDCRALISYASISRVFDVNILIRPFQLAGGLFFEYVLGQSYDPFLNQFPALRMVNLIFTLESLFLLIGLMTFFSYRKTIAFAVFYFIGFSLLYLITKTPSYMHYFIIIAPFIFILTAQGIVNSCLYIKHRFQQSTAIVLPLLFICANIYFVAAFVAYLNVNRYTLGTYGLVFAQKEAYVTLQTGQYKTLPYYHSIETMAYLILDEGALHAKLGEYFAQKKNIDAALSEYDKAEKLK